MQYKTLITPQLYLKIEEIEEEWSEDSHSGEEIVENTTSVKGKVMASVLLGFVGLSFLPLQLLKEEYIPVSSGQGQRLLLQTSSTTTVNPWNNFLPVSWLSIKIPSSFTS